MAKKCTKCGVPLEGILSIIGKLTGVKPSTTEPGVCNKCEGNGSVAEPSPTPPLETPAPENLNPPSGGGEVI